MIALRIRRHGSPDWTYCYFSGEDDEHFLLLIAARAYAGFVVERRASDESWIPFDEFEEEEE